MVLSSLLSWNIFPEAKFSLLLEVEISVPYVRTQVDIHLLQHTPNDGDLQLLLLSLHAGCCHQLQGSPLHVGGHGDPLHTLQEGHHHHVFSHPQTCDSLLYSTSCVEFSVGEGASSLGHQTAFSMWGRGPTSSPTRWLTSPPCPSSPTTWWRRWTSLCNIY